MEINSSLKTVLKRLRLSPVLHTLPDRLAYAGKTRLAHADFLELVLQDEIDRREHKSLQLRIEKADFTEERTLESFDWDAPVTFDRDRVRDLFGLGFLERHEDVIFMGPVGVGKSHLAEALGHAACRAGKHVLCCRADDLFKEFLQSRADHTTSKVLRRHLAPHLLIVDDFALRRLDARQSSDIYEDPAVRRPDARPKRPRPPGAQRPPSRHGGRELPQASSTRRPAARHRGDNERPQQEKNEIAIGDRDGETDAQTPCGSCRSCGRPGHAALDRTIECGRPQDLGNPCGISTAPTGPAATRSSQV